MDYQGFRGQLVAQELRASRDPLVKRVGKAQQG